MNHKKLTDKNSNSPCAGQDAAKVEDRWLLSVVLIALGICLTFVLGISSILVDRVATASCFDQLDEAAKWACHQIKSDVSRDETMLMALANYLGKLDDLHSAEALDLLGQGSETLTELVLLYPDNTILTPDGTIVDASSVLNFAELVSKGAHVSRRSVMSDEPDHLIVRIFQPVEQEGTVTAILFGMVDLDNLPEIYSEFVDGGDELHLLEGDTGDFLLDTVHKDLGSALNLGTRDPVPGYDTGLALQEISEGKSGHIAFYSTTLQQNLYCTYMPVGINDWMVLYGTPEEAVFAPVYHIRSILYVTSGLVALCLLVAFLVMYRRERKHALQNHNALERTRAARTIETQLLGITRSEDCMLSALGELAQSTQAKLSFLLVARAEGYRLYQWPKSEKLPGHVQARLLELARELGPGGELICNNPQELVEKYHLPQQSGMNSLMLIPAVDNSQHIVGALGVANLSGEIRSTLLLQNVVRSFLLALGSLESYHAAERLGMRDRLTGLLNRNAYQLELEENGLLPHANVVVIYLDADGLHALNNHCGHEAGDQMLMAMATALRGTFVSDKVYRIGGDEFVIISRTLTQSTTPKKLRTVHEELANNSYHASMGAAYGSEAANLNALVKLAESRMYDAKHDYYAQRNAAEEARQLDLRLERSLREKRDLEIFRRAMASKFAGLYIVDLVLDTMRSIYIPPYFANMAQRTDGQFSAALKLYAQERVVPEERTEFLRFVNYDTVKSELQQGHTPSMVYHRVGAGPVRLYIGPCPGEAPRSSETIWTFETMPPDGTQG